MLATSDGWRRFAAILLLLTSLGAQLGVAPRIQRLRAALGPDIEAVPASDARRVSFGRLHGVSVALLGLGMLGAAALAIGGTVGRVAGTRAGARPAVPSSVPLQHTPGA